MSAWKRVVTILLLASIALFAATSAALAAYEKANALFTAKKLSEAFTAVEEALRLDPNLVPALTLKAKLAMAINRLDVARQCLEHALTVDPRAAYAQFLYGLEAFLGNDLKEALPRFRKARELSPADPRAALYLGLTVESVGEPAEAMSLYEEAVHLERAARELHAETLLPGARLLLLLNRLDECDRWLRQALQLSPNLRDSHFELARLLLKKGNSVQAAAEGEIALRLSEGVITDAAIHYQLVRAYRQSGDSDKAEMHAAIMRAQESPSPGKAKQ